MFILKFSFSFRWNKCVLMIKETYLPLMLFAFVNVIHEFTDEKWLTSWF